MEPSKINSIFSPVPKEPIQSIKQDRNVKTTDLEDIRSRTRRWGDVDADVASLDVTHLDVHLDVLQPVYGVRRRGRFVAEVVGD